MSNNPSTTTVSVAFRLDKDVYAILARRARQNKMSPSQYLKERVSYDLTRKHR
jgi:hypothetical protein